MLSHTRLNSTHLPQLYPSPPSSTHHSTIFNSVSTLPNPAVCTCPLKLYTLLITMQLLSTLTNSTQLSSQHYLNPPQLYCNNLYSSRLLIPCRCTLPGCSRRWGILHSLAPHLSWVRSCWFGGRPLSGYVWRAACSLGLGCGRLHSVVGQVPVQF